MFSFYWYVSNNLFTFIDSNAYNKIKVIYIYIYNFGEHSIWFMDVIFLKIYYMSNIFHIMLNKWYINKVWIPKELDPKLRENAIIWNSVLIEDSYQSYIRVISESYQKMKLKV